MSNKFSEFCMNVKEKAEKLFSKSDIPYEKVENSFQDTYNKTNATSDSSTKSAEFENPSSTKKN